MQLDRDELSHVPGAAELAHRREEAARLAVRAEDEPVEQHQVRARAVEVIAAK